MQLNSVPLRLIPLVLILVLAISIIGPGEAKADPGWYDSDWQYRKKITINSANVSGSTNHEYFPVLISVTDSDLASHARSDGWDILFTASDETTKLQHEIESYNATSQKLVAWVEIPSLSPSTDTDIYMYYGNGGVTNSSENVTGVWDNADYKMVQHLEETSGGTDAITDSTANSNNGTDINTPTFGATGQMDGAIGFDGSSEYIDCGDEDDLDFGQDADFTIEAWIKTSSTDVRKGIVSKRSVAGSYVGYEMEVVNTNIIRGRLRKSGVGGADVDTVSSSTVTDGNWHYVVFTADRNANGQIYIDGSADGSPVDISGQNGDLSNSDSFWIASDVAAGYFNGNLDEIRISNTLRNADWIKTSYNNQSNPGDFLTFSSEKSQIVVPTVTTNATTLITETTANISGTLTDDGGEACQYSFEWGTATGVYTDNISWTGSINSVQSFSVNITGLNKGDVYYYRARAMNSAGIRNGDELTFLTKPDPPTDLTATTFSSSQINLSWTKAASANNTLVRRKEGGYPANITDGEQVYFDTGTETSDTGLMPNTTYFYSAWSEVSGSQQYSTTAAQANATTSSGQPTVIGGLVLPINKAAVLAPWLCLGVILSVVIARIIIYIRKRRSS